MEKMLFFSYCKKLNIVICVNPNVYYYEDIKTKKNNFYRLKSEILQKKTLKNSVFLHTKIIRYPTPYGVLSDQNMFVFMFWVSLDIQTLIPHGK